MPPHGRWREAGGWVQLSYSQGLAHVSPVTESVLVCFPGEVHAYGEGWGHLSREECQGKLSPEEQGQLASSAVPNKEQGQPSQGQ